MNINKKRKTSEKDSFEKTYESNQKTLDKYLLNMYSTLRNFKNNNRKKKIKSMLTSNIINYKQKKIQHHKSEIKKNLESSINLSKNNFCGSFLVPDYFQVSGATLLKELRKKGPEIVVSKHFSRDYPKANLIRNYKSCSITRNNSKNKSKYFELMNSNVSRINKITSFKKPNKAKLSNKLKYYDKYNKSFFNFFNGESLKAKNSKKKYFDFNIHKNNKFYEKSGCNNNNISIKSFNCQSLNNSRSILSANTSCSSKNLKYYKKN
jgi:hypothetical protein